MKKIVFLISIIVCICCFFEAYAQSTWVDFGNNGEINQPPEINMITTSNYSIDFYGVNNFRKIINDTAFDEMNLPRTYTKSIDLGFPQLPILTFYIEVTSDTPIITINSINFDFLHFYNLIPVQETETMAESDTINAFTKNDSVYNVNQFYPSDNVIVSLPSVCRGHKIATVEVYPVQFNPVTKQIKVVQNIDFVIHNAGSIESDKDNVLYDNFLKSNVINYEPNSTPDYNIDLLIISPDEFEDELIPFIELKNQLGIRTRVVNKTEIGINNWFADPIPDDNYTGIDGYIHTIYSLGGSSAPEFILLIGETNLLPTHYWNSSPYPLASDMYYTTMNVENPNVTWIFDFPDMFLGRLSVDNCIELHNILNKIEKYSILPNTNNSNFYSTLLLAAYFQLVDFPSGNELFTERGYYTWTSERIAEHLLPNYNINRVYETQTPTPLYYRNGTEVNPDIDFYGEEGGFLAEEAVPAIIDQINEGCFLINHRDHGSSANHYNYIHPSAEFWVKPNFSENDIQNLTNSDFFPIMFSVNCQTGWFDGATDFQLPNNYDCFGEQLLSAENKGIVGFIGSARTSYSGFNEELDIGLIDAIWPDFDLFSSEIQVPTYFLGTILDNGKLFMYKNYILTNGGNYGFDPPSVYEKRLAFEEYHVLGDPTLEMWTGVPQPLYAYVDYTQNMVTVYDDNDQVIPSAKVVIQYGPEEEEEYEVKMTDINGRVYSGFLNNLDVEVSALKHNYIPWFTTKITGNTIWDSDEAVRGNIIVGSGCTLTFGADVNIPKYSRIIVEQGGTLNVGQNVTVNFGNGYCGILAYGNFICQQNSTLSLTPEGEATDKADIELKNGNLNYSYNYLTVKNCIIKGVPFSLSINNSNFIFSGIETERGNADIRSTGFDVSYVKIRNASENNKLVNISDNCSFAGDACHCIAVEIDNYPNFKIDNCIIRGYSDAISLYNCGYGTKEQQVSYCDIYDNSNSGITVYRTTADILHNSITENLFGIKSYDRSAVHLEGVHTIVTQEISDNTSNEVYAARGSFPQYFHWNLIQDDDNIMGDPLVKYTGNEYNLDVRNNCWGNNFSLIYDLEPSGHYLSNPVWNCMQGAGSGSGSSAEALYLEARVDIENEDFIEAKSGFGQIVSEFPESEYAKAALKELYPLEELTGNNYIALKAYYFADSAIQNNEELAKLADFLANFCEIKLENWPTAIAWFENVVENPESMEDSIFAIIDMGYTYWLIENGGLKSTYMGRMGQYKFSTREEFEANRDFLLSLLPGDQLSETMKQSLSTLKSGQLLQNVPNPFNGTTQIWFKLAEESSVTVTVYDYTGKEVSIIKPGLLETGNHTVEFNSSNLSSGIYFYSLEVNGIKTDTKKMTLIK
jgi:hypothetical protein